MRLRRTIASILALVLYLSPTSVFASQYSGFPYFFKYWPPHIPEAAAACGQAGIIDTAQDFQIAYTRKWIASFDCSGVVFGVTAGLLGVNTSGYRDGALCGSTSTYYNTYTADNWAIWAYMCSNPSGSQSFYSQGHSIFYTGLEWKSYVKTSPSQSY